MRREAYSGRLKYPQCDTTISSRNLFLFVFLTFLVILSTTTKLTAASLAAGAGAECRGTVGDCMETSGEEFLMDSETTRRILLGNARGKSIDYRVLKKHPLCDAKRYGSCIGPRRGMKMNCYYDNRSCVK